MIHRFAKLFWKTASLVLAAGILISGQTASAQPETDSSSVQFCSTQTLAGNYGFTSEGVLLNTPGLPPEAQFRSVGVTTFDGKGNLSWMEHTVINGMPLETGWTPATGTYTVNTNCTGMAIVNTPNSPVPLNLFFTIVRRGTELHTVLNASAVSTDFIKVD